MGVTGGMPGVRMHGKHGRYAWGEDAWETRKLQCMPGVRRGNSGGMPGVRMINPSPHSSSPSPHLTDSQCSAGTSLQSSSCHTLTVGVMIGAGGAAG